MIANPLLSALALLLLAPAQATLPTHSEPLRNTFITAAETVIDEASALDIHADDAPFRAGMQQVLAARENLQRMAEDDREQDIASATNDLVFVVQACHVQAKDGANTARCEAQVSSSRARAMDALRKHKAGGVWVDGPPAT